MSQYDRVTVRDGVVLNKRTIAMLTVVERRLGWDVRIVQGSYHKGVGASAGTHDGGGAVDLEPYRVAATVLAMRKVGFAAWHRKAIPGVWGEHIHAVAIGDRDLSPAAVRQVSDYLAGRDGLAAHGPDDGPKVKIRPWALVRRVVAVRMATRELDRWRRDHS